MDPIRDIGRFGVVPGDHTWSDGHPVSGLRRAITTLRQRVNSFEDSTRALEPWKKQSPLEWKERVQRLADAAVGSLEPLAGDVQLARTRLDEVRRQLVYRPERRDSARAIRLMEIRGALSRLDPLQVGAVLDTAIENGDADVVEAVLDAPSVLQLVDAGRSAAAKAAWVRRADPDAAAEETDLQSAVEVFEANLSVALNVIRQAAELPERDPVATTAAVGEEVAAEV